MFSIEVDRFTAMICNSGWGFWTPDTARDFLAAERDAIEDLGLALGELLILFDASRFSVQDQEVIRILRHPANPLYNARRGAFVTPPGLGKLQIRRGNPQGNIGVFETNTEARDFLLAV
ncbi:hypothetical protein [Sphingomonas sp.]|uniref:hypothetical protein n=1 Tax=Sphingomonas sp. TaxID=28214 RepID=UPI002DD6857A|nr:hypothetical protein [Sphingomonas sp.]